MSIEFWPPEYRNKVGSGMCINNCADLVLMMDKVTGSEIFYSPSVNPIDKLQCYYWIDDCVSVCITKKTSDYVDIDLFSDDKIGSTTDTLKIKMPFYKADLNLSLLKLSHKLLHSSMLMKTLLIVEPDLNLAYSHRDVMQWLENYYNSNGFKSKLSSRYMRLYQRFGDDMDYSTIDLQIAIEESVDTFEESGDIETNLDVKVSALNDSEKSKFIYSYSQVDKWGDEESVTLKTINTLLHKKFNTFIFSKLNKAILKSISFKMKQAKVCMKMASAI